MRLYRNQWNPIEINEEKIEEIVRQRRISFATAKFLLSKEMTVRELNTFLEGSFSGERIEDSSVAAELLKKHRDHKVVIFGDYDVDGMSSSTLLGDFLQANGYEVQWIIPNRYQHGYGLNEKSLPLIPSDTELLITVDCGISSVKEVAFLKEKGISVIVTDHHEPKEELPSCVILNPKLKNPKLSQLAGVGVVYLWCKYLVEEEGFTPIEEMEALASLGTVADLMPLRGDNRAIVKEGLVQLNQIKRSGLKKLIESLEIKEDVSAWHIGFRIGPLLNAAGRMGKEEVSMRALSQQGLSQQDLQTLLSLNEQRKAEEEKILKEVDKRERETTFCVVEASTDWLQGVLGLAASRISDNYRLPTYLFTLEEGVYKGSCRSVGNFDILQSLESVKELLLTYGGHKQAAGVQIREENFEEVKKQLDSYATEFLKEEDRRKTFSYLPIEPQELSLSLATELQCLAPYGMGNPTPVFGLKDCQLTDVKIYKNKFYRLCFQKEGQQWIATYFSSRREDFRKGQTYDIIYTPEVNYFRGNSTLELRLKDYRNKSFLSPVLNPFYLWRTLELAKSFAYYNEENKGIFFVSPKGYFQYESPKSTDYEFPKKLPNLFLWKEYLVDKDLVEEEIISSIVDRQELMKGYQYVKSRKEIPYDQVQNLLKTFFIFEIFSELGLVQPEYLEDKVRYKIVDVKEKVSLEESKIYCNALRMKEEWNEFKG